MKKAMATVMVMAAMLLATPGTNAQAAKVKMSKPSMTLKVGQSKTLKLKNAAGKVKWTTSKKSVAAVTKKGKVTARKAGSALIWAQAKGHTYRCNVTVINATKKDNANNAADTENTDITNTDSAGTSATDTQTTTEGTQPDKTETTPAHEHDWVPHYTYGADGRPRKDAMFCSDVTCPYNNGYGTDNGWRGESLTGNTGTETTETSQGTAVQQPTTPVTGNTGNTQDTVTTKPSVTEPVVTETPVQEEQPKEEHHHAWTIPVLSDDKLTVTGYACACGETGHVHSWDIVHKVESGFSAGAVKYWECSKCGETINTADYDELVKANNAASETIKQAWIAKNITDGMTDSEKVQAILDEMHSWSYGNPTGHLPANIAHRAMCSEGNSWLVIYCKEIGIQAEKFDASEVLPDEERFSDEGIPITHYMTYVWIDGVQRVCDATPTGGYMGNGIISLAMYELNRALYTDEITLEEFYEREKQLCEEEGREWQPPSQKIE